MRMFLGIWLSFVTKACFIILLYINTSFRRLNDVVFHAYKHIQSRVKIQ
jgi:hypothetical protein